jgi:hypothetical protein
VLRSMVLRSMVSRRTEPEELGLVAMRSLVNN